MKFLNRIDAFVGMLILPIIALPTGIIFLIESIRNNRSYEADIMGIFSGIFLGTWIILLTIFFLTGVFKILTVNENGISWKSILGHRQFQWGSIVSVEIIEPKRKSSFPNIIYFRDKEKHRVSFELNEKRLNYLLRIVSNDIIVELLKELEEEYNRPTLF